MFCKNCGQEIGGDTQFCQNCGSNLNGITNNTKSTNSGHNNQNMLKIIRAIIGILIVGSFLIYSVYNSLDEDEVIANNNAVENFRSGDNDAAIKQLQEASNSAVVDNNKINTLKNLAYVYSSEGDNESAISTFKEALKLVEINSFDYYLIAGEIDLLEIKPNAALAKYNIAYSMNPDDFQINNALSLYYLDLEDISPQSCDYQKSLVFAKKAYEIDKSEISKQNLALSHYFNNNFEEAISLILSSDYINDPYLSYWLGLAYLGKGDEVSAKTHLNRAIEGGVEAEQEIIDYVNAN